ncbi:helix-turn-helix transcriptional regulator [Belnapia sp. T6]|uniref:Helix-turn-helix transcriptional regulator n=1 Tax=Belnapia mucosa TaxID=2804532 RepID=A0ABS1VBK9_9PROT|nr:helix-turn-helix transcriptional regulator [Belnapia mucosa]MBL6459060.1 helix-turn-helix transcriptional regulator [Belnapia mucosa]
MSDLPAHDHADQQQLRLILAALQDGVILIEPNQHIAWANKAALKMHGVREIAELGATVSEYRERFELRYRNRHHLPNGHYPMERVLAGEAFDEVVVEVAPAGQDEAQWTHRIRSLVLNDTAGMPDCLVLILNDESERFDAEDRFETTFAANPAPAIILRLSDHRHVKVNRGFLEMTGYSEEQVLGRSVYEIDVLEGAARRELAIERLQSGRTIPQMEAVLQLSGGGEKRVIVAGQPIEVGDAACMLFSFVDLERHKLTEDALSQSEASFATAFRLAPVPTFIAARAGCRVMLANDAFTRESGYAEPELVGKTAGEIGLWFDKVAGKELERQLHQNGSVQNLDVKLRTKEGGVFDCLVSAAAVTLGNQPCVLVVAQDAGERRRTEAEVVAAIEAVMQDTSWFSQVVLEKLAKLRRFDAPSGAAAELVDLPQRAREVLTLVCRGMADPSIARKLRISPNTVRNHVASLYRRTGVNSRTALVIWARERGFDGGPPRKTPQPTSMAG